MCQGVIYGTCQDEQFSLELLSRPSSKAFLLKVSNTASGKVQTAHCSTLLTVLREDTSKDVILTFNLIQKFITGFVCVRGFDRESRAPRPLKARLHFPASKMTKQNEQNKKNRSNIERAEFLKMGTYSSGFVMDGIPVTFLCYWGGNILNPHSGCEYDIPPKRPLRANSRWSYENLITELYKVTGLNKRDFKLGVICRFPISFDHSTANYTALHISDNSCVEAMFDAFTYFSGIGSLQLYLEIEPIDNLGFATDTEVGCSHYVGGIIDSHVDEGNPGPSTFQSDVGTTNQIDLVVPTDISPHGPRNARGLNDDLETDSEDDEDYIENRLMEEDDGSSSSSSDIGETSTEDNNMDVNELPENRINDIDCPFYKEIGEGSCATDIRASQIQLSVSDQLVKGLLFRSKNDMQCAVKKYHIKRNWRYKVRKSTDKTWAICCYKKEYPCNFYLRASFLLKKNGLWEVTRYRGPHTCLCAGLGQDHFHLDSKLIAWDILNLVKVDPDLKIRVIVEYVKNSFNKEISYKKAWCGKQKAIAQIYGDWEESYQRLPKVLAAIKQYNPETIVEFYRPPLPGQMDKFRRVFWAFGPCIHAFTHCRPVVSIDGTFLHGMYKGVLLIAMGCDANDSILPLAFAIVKNESFKTWNWFLNLVQEHVVKGREICLISYRHQGILSAIRESRCTNITHRYCLRHVRANFCKVHTGGHLKRLVWKAGCSHQDRKFKGVLEQIELLSKDALTWLRRLDKKKWTIAHDGGYRYGIMTTNISEVFNGVMKGARGMPITAIIEQTFYRCVFYFQSRLGIAELAMENIGLPNTQPQNRFSPKVYQMLLHNTEKVGGMHVTIFNNSGRGDSGVYSVITGRRMTKGGNTQTVRFDRRTCTCGKWVAYHVPCSHVLACCNYQNVDPSTFVSSFYTVENYLRTWSGRFEPLEDEAYWNEYNGLVFEPNPNLERKKGRPKSRRIRNEMDFQADKRVIHCSTCGKEGHTRRTCTQNRDND
ncbi:hypothetical protein RD792_013477 [Penstemon davidsonii]|uniref:SWIM-type domain-containing protein n=1 Tax=Penstemon davidsonii TaxID=160366 RepID=A0ABR0CTM0_9LAMI|nr:hypothetical protein RD792_013477 [Penstemon davidsonii]